MKGNTITGLLDQALSFARDNIWDGKFPQEPGCAPLTNKILASIDNDYIGTVKTINGQQEYQKLKFSDSNSKDFLKDFDSKESDDQEKLVSRNLGVNDKDTIIEELERLKEALKQLRDDDKKVATNALELAQRQTIMYHKTLKELRGIKAKFLKRVGG